MLGLALKENYESEAKCGRSNASIHEDKNSSEQCLERICTDHHNPYNLQFKSKVL